MPVVLQMILRIYSGKQRPFSFIPIHNIMSLEVHHRYGVITIVLMIDKCLQGGKLLDQNGSQAKFITQTSALTRRSFRNMRRDLGYYWLRFIIYIALGVSIGSVFRNVGTSWNSIRVRSHNAVL